MVPVDELDLDVEEVNDLALLDWIGRDQRPSGAHGYRVHIGEPTTPDVRLVDT